MKSHVPLLAGVLVLAGAAAILLAAEGGVTAPGAKLQKMADGFSWTEGACCDAAGNVFFTDQESNRILKYSLDGKLTTFMQPAGRANGMCFDAKGNLWVCADEKNELWCLDPNNPVAMQAVEPPVYQPDWQKTVVVKDYQGKLLNGPNDVWVRPDGGLYITDPMYARSWWKRDPKEQLPHAVYYLAPDHKALVRVIDDMKQPNGIVGTPDGKTLYVADAGDRKTYAYDIQPDGSLAGKRLLCEKGSDGMTMDAEGNLYLTGRGVTVVDKTGKEIEKIDVPEQVGNVCFGGKDLKTLFITASKSLYAIPMRVKGAGSQ
jgi:gluconolactonase